MFAAIAGTNPPSGWAAARPAARGTRWRSRSLPRPSRPQRPARRGKALSPCPPRPRGRSIRSKRASRSAAAAALRSSTACWAAALCRDRSILIGGDPGIGKSTLLLQVSALLAGQGARVLYVSGEESARQIKMRAKRLGVGGSGMYVLSETNMDEIEAQRVRAHTRLHDRGLHPDRLCPRQRRRARLGFAGARGPRAF